MNHTPNQWDVTSMLTNSLQTFYLPDTLGKVKLNFAQTAKFCKKESKYGVARLAERLEGKADQ
jgi:hypothetical protein